MKRLLIGLLFLAVALGCAGQIVYRDTATVMWDASPTVVLPGEAIEYNVYLWDMSGGDPTLQPLALLTLVDRVVGLELAVDMTAYPRAEYAVAVQSVFIQEDFIEIEDTEAAYSTVAADVDPTSHPSGRFTYVSELGVLNLEKPSGLRDSGI